MARRRYNTPGDVCWVLPGKKKPFAWSTQAVNGFIWLLAEDGSTFRQCRDKLNSEFDDFSGEATAILDYFIEHGYADTVARTMLRKVN